MSARTVTRTDPSMLQRHASLDEGSAGSAGRRGERSNDAGRTLIVPCAPTKANMALLLVVTTAFALFSSCGASASDREDERQTIVGSEEDEADEENEADEEQQSREADAREEEVVVVTGSRLKDPMAAAASLILTREDFKRRGLSSVEDVIRSLSQNYSDVNAAGLDNDDLGQSTVNLRGLGSASTLVLVNGRRWVQSSTFGDGTANLNSIPFGAIERVEMLPEGASAIYGADAQAGVVNFILRKHFVGGETRLRRDVGANEGDALDIEQMFGYGWMTGDMLATLGYRKDDPVDARKAGFTTMDFRSRGGEDHRLTQFGQPAVVSHGFLEEGIYPVPVLTLGSLPAGNDGTQGIDGFLSPDHQIPFDLAGVNGGTAESEGFTGYVRADQRLRDGLVTAYGELQYSVDDSETKGIPLFELMAVPYTNPYNDLQPDPIFEILASYAFDFETEAGWMQPLSNTAGHRNLTAAVGVSAELPFREWTMDLSSSYGKEKSYFGYARVNLELLEQRMAGIDVDGSPLPREQIINPFGDGSAQNQEAVAGLIKKSVRAPENSSAADQISYLASFDGELFDLPAGPVLLVLGGEFRTETLDYSTNDIGPDLFIVLQPERDVVSWFTEWGVPFVSEYNAITGIHSLALQLAVRHDQYSFSGPFDGPRMAYSERTFDSMSPKFSLTWYPVADLNFRISWSESFVPPINRDLFTAEDGPYYFIGVEDPQNPEIGLQFPESYFIANPDLKPETSENLSIGFNWQPDNALEGLEVGATYFVVDIRDRIQGGFFAVTRPHSLFDIQGAVERAPDGSISRLNLIAINTSEVESRSIDASISYDFEALWGSFTVGLEGTYTQSLRQIDLPGDDPIRLEATLDGPDRIRNRSYLNYSRNSLYLNLETFYSSSYANTLSETQDRVNGYRTFNLTATYQFPDSGWEVQAGSRNLFNADFPFIDTPDLPWDPFRVDTRGRVVFLEVVKSY